MAAPQYYTHPAGMPRQRRIHAPGAGFHITARTQSGEKFFVDELRDEVVAIICEAASTFGHALLAFVLMPNHFHLVIRQSDAPLGWMMQRVMQRIALKVQKRNNVEGHVFGRRYWSSPCLTPKYLRRAIVYAHLNPWEWRLCGDSLDYRWSSHAAYLSDDAAWAKETKASDGRVLFADDSLELTKVTASYQRFVQYVMERRRSGIPGDWLLPEGRWRHDIPLARHGDSHWATTYSAIAHDGYERARLIPVRDKAALVLKKIDRECGLDTLRNGGRRKAVCALRRQVAAALVSSGYGGSAIARCLRVSPSYVSHLKAAMLASATPQNSKQAP